MEQYISKSALVEEIEKLENTYKKCPTRNSYEEGLKDGRLIGYKDALYKINTLPAEEEPVSNVWNDARKTIPEDSIEQIICIKEDGLAVVTIGKIVSGTVKWAYLDTLLHTSNKNLSEKQCRKLIDTAFELGKEAKRQELLKRFKAQKGEEI